MAMIKASNGVFSAMICGGTVVNVQKLCSTGKLSYAEMQSKNNAGHEILYLERLEARGRGCV